MTLHTRNPNAGSLFVKSLLGEINIDDLLKSAIEHAKDWAKTQARTVLGPEKKAQAIEWLTNQVESIDNLIPVIGQYLDLPVVDQAEKYLIEQAVERAWYLLEKVAA